MNKVINKEIHETRMIAMVQDLDDILCKLTMLIEETRDIGLKRINSYLAESFQSTFDAWDTINPRFKRTNSLKHN